MSTTTCTAPCADWCVSVCPGFAPRYQQCCAYINVVPVLPYSRCLGNCIGGRHCHRIRCYIRCAASRQAQARIATCDTMSRNNSACTSIDTFTQCTVQRTHGTVPGTHQSPFCIPNAWSTFPHAAHACSSATPGGTVDPNNAHTRTLPRWLATNRYPPAVMLHVSVPAAPPQSPAPMVWRVACIMADVRARRCAKDSSTGTLAHRGPGRGCGCTTRPVPACYTSMANTSGVATRERCRCPACPTRTTAPR